MKVYGQTMFDHYERASRAFYHGSEQPLRLKVESELWNKRFWEEMKKKELSVRVSVSVE